MIQKKEKVYTISKDVINKIEKNMVIKNVIQIYIDRNKQDTINYIDYHYPQYNFIKTKQEITCIKKINEKRFIIIYDIVKYVDYKNKIGIEIHFLMDFKKMKTEIINTIELENTLELLSHENVK